MNLDDYRALKARVDQAKREADRAAGALEQTMKRLKAEYNCSTIKQARAVLAQLQQEQTALAREFDQKMKAFNTKWSAQLNS